MNQRKIQKQPYEVLKVEEFLRTKAITFKAHDLPPWTIFIDKKVWTQEVEKNIITNRIKELRQELKNRAFKELYAELTETQSNILWSLVINGPCSSSLELCKRKIKVITPQGPKEIEVGKKTTIQRDLNYLKEHGLVKIGRRCGKKRGKPCSLTTMGLFRIFEMDMPEIWARFDNIVCSNKALVPRVFKRWKKFIKDEIADDFKVNIIDYFKDPLQNNLISYCFLKHVRPTTVTERALTEDMTRHVLLPQIFLYAYKIFLPELFEVFDDFSMHILPEKEEVENWFRMLIRYRNLRGYLLKELERLKCESRNFSLLMKRWKSILCDLKNN